MRKDVTDVKSAYYTMKIGRQQRNVKHGARLITLAI